MSRTIFKWEPIFVKTEWNCAYTTPSNYLHYSIRASEVVHLMRLEKAIFKLSASLLDTADYMTLPCDALTFIKIEQKQNVFAIIIQLSLLIISFIFARY